MITRPEFRPVKRNATCRACENVLKQGDHAFVWWSSSGGGYTIVLCPTCIRKMQSMIGANDGSDTGI